MHTETVTASPRNQKSRSGTEMDSKVFVVVEGGKKPQQDAVSAELDRLYADFKAALERQKPPPKLPPPLGSGRMSHA